MTKPVTKAAFRNALARMEQVNGEVPHRLAEAAARSGAALVHISTDGVFDGASAWELRHALEAVHKGSKVVLDFTRVREFYDFGVAVLAYGLAQRSPAVPRVTLKGLRTHQLRMFRYFGVDAG